MLHTIDEYASVRSVLGIRVCKTLPRNSLGDTPIQAAVRAGYARGESPKELAAMLCSTPQAIRVMACKLELTRNNRADPAKFRRGFKIPDDKYDAYLDLKRKMGQSMTCREVGEVLGIIRRD